MVGVKLETRKPITIAYMQYKGSYSSIPFDQYMGRLYGWAKENKIMPGMHAMGIFYSDPKSTPPAECVADIAIPIYGESNGSGDIKVRALPAMDVASYSHKGPASEYQNSYNKIVSWIMENKYTVAGPPMEIYSKKPKMVNGELIIYTKIMFPVKKLQ